MATTDTKPTTDLTSAEQRVRDSVIAARRRLIDSGFDAIAHRLRDDFACYVKAVRETVNAKTSTPTGEPSPASCKECGGPAKPEHDYCRGCCPHDLSHDDDRPCSLCGHDEPKGEPDATEGPVMIAGYDVRPKCLACGEKWWPPEGVDAREVPCPACRKRESMRVVGDATEGPAPAQGERTCGDFHNTEYWLPLMHPGACEERPAAPTVEPPEPDEDLPSCIEVHGDDRTGWGWDPAESTQLPCCWTRAEAEAQAHAFVDSITAPHRARAEALEGDLKEAQSCIAEWERLWGSAVRHREEWRERAAALKRERDEARERAAAAEREREESMLTATKAVAGRCLYNAFHERDKDEAERWRDLAEHIGEAGCFPASITQAIDAYDASIRAPVEAERDTLRALLERCDPLLADLVTGLPGGRHATCSALLTDIRAALHQAKEQPARDHENMAGTSEREAGEAHAWNRAAEEARDRAAVLRAPAPPQEGSS